MRSTTVLLIAATCFTGCTHLELERHTISQARTLADVHMQQVVDNLAMFVDSPDSLPFFSVAGTGQTNVRQDYGINGAFSWDLISRVWLFDKVSTTPTTTNSSQDQWTTASVIYPEELKIMRCAYQRTAGHSCQECDVILQSFFKDNAYEMLSMQPGWYCVGKHCDVPSHARYVGHFRSTYVWVTDEGLDGLSRLTIAMLDIGTAEIIKPQKPKTAAMSMLLNLTPEQREYLKSKGLLEMIEKAAHDESVESYRGRKNFYNPLQSPINPGP